ncbi:MAG: hypothetical protein ACQESC_02600 [Nanobdellota archaeon]
MILLFCSGTKSTKGQSSIEYLFIVAIALLLIVPGTALFYQHSRNSQQSIEHSQLSTTGYDLIKTGEMIYSIGENSWQTIEITFPESVHSLTAYTVNNSLSELELTYGSKPYSHIVFFTSNPLLNSTANNASSCFEGCPIPIHTGLTSIRVESGTSGEIRYRVID